MAHSLMAARRHSLLEVHHAGTLPETPFGVRLGPIEMRPGNVPGPNPVLPPENWITLVCMCDKCITTNTPLYCFAHAHPMAQLTSAQLEQDSFFLAQWTFTHFRQWYPPPTVLIKDRFHGDFDTYRLYWLWNTPRGPGPHLGLPHCANRPTGPFRAQPEDRVPALSPAAGPETPSAAPDPNLTPTKRPRGV